MLFTLEKYPVDTEVSIKKPNIKPMTPKRKVIQPMVGFNESGISSSWHCVISLGNEVKLLKPGLEIRLAIASATK